MKGYKCLDCGEVTTTLSDMNCCECGSSLIENVEVEDDSEIRA